MKQKEEKRAKVLMATAAAFIVVLAFSGIVSADPYCGGLPLTNVKEGEVSGDLWFEHYSPLTHNHAEESFTLPSYTDVEWAQLYVAVYCGHMQKNYAGRANITFNGFQLGGTTDGLSSEAFDVCYTYPGKEYTTACERGSAGYNDAPGPGTGPEWVNDHCVRVTSDYLMWYNVTDLVQPNSNVVVDTWNMEGYTGTFDNRTKVITLVVAYNDGDSDTVHYWVNQGHDVDNYYLDNQGEPNYIGETIFAADLPTGSTLQKSNLTVVQMASEDGTYTYNTDSIPTDPDGTTTPPGENWQDDYSGYNMWYASSQFNSNSDNTLNYDRIGGFYKIFLGLLTAEYTEESTDSPDLVPTKIKAKHNYHNGAWTLLNNTVNVTVENIDSGDAGAFDVKLYAKLNGNFEEIGSETVSSLLSGDSAEASFVWKPSEVGDYSLKTVVDSDNSIAESNETNNELIKLQSAGHNGYVGDKPLTTYAHGKIKGNISFTHGDSFYSGKLNNGDTYTVHHTVNIPDGATLKFA
ncbi:Serine protease, subtilase family, partial [Candidatus Methanophagaceae archaeon]